MKRLLRHLWLLSFFYASVAWPGGTAVTNGRQFYKSPAGFSVSYGEPLSLNVISKASFVITNEKLVRRGETPSRITFEVNKKKVESPEEIRALLAAEYPGKKIVPVTQPGAKGYFWEERADSTLEARYALLTSNGDFVEISVNANSAGDGIGWIAPIVRSLTYDVTVPTVLGLRADTSEWTAGQTHKLFFRITDDYSGVKNLGSLRFDQIGPDGRRLKEGHRFFLNEKLHAEGNDWYSWSFRVNEFTPEGSYVLSTIYVDDNARNTLSFVADTQDPPIAYEGFPKPYAGPRLPVLKVKVRNLSGQADSDAPEVRGFRPDASVWRAGSTHRVFIKITDNLSGLEINPQATCIGGLGSTFKKNDLLFSIRGKTCELRSEGNDWYSAEYTIPKYQPAGRYAVGNIRIEDKARNMTLHWFGRDPVNLEPGLVSPFFIQIENDGVDDVKAPRVIDWKLDSDVWRPGETQTVHVRVEDDLSGLQHIDWLAFDGPAGGSMTKYYTSDSEGNGWYAVRFKVDEFAKAGEYKVSSIRLSDQVSNESYLRCENDVCKEENGALISLPPLSFRLVR